VEVAIAAQSVKSALLNPFGGRFMTQQRLDFNHGAIPQALAELTDRQLETALETAATCFAIWRLTSFEQRAAAVASAAARLRTRVGRATSLK
jgi:succinate-semialdehyde dehydrogenase/glutarate-semialdehyde dehydrogenase